MKQVYTRPTISCMEIEEADIITTSLLYKDSAYADKYTFGELFGNGNV